MILLGIVFVWAGYGVGSWGYILVKGYNITLREWFSPLSPYQWPAAGKNIPTVPAGHLFPTGSATAATAAGGTPGAGGPPGTGGGQPGGGTIPA